MSNLGATLVHRNAFWMDQRKAMDTVRLQTVQTRYGLLHCLLSSLLLLSIGSFVVISQYRLFLKPTPSWFLVCLGYSDVFLVLHLPLTLTHCCLSFPKLGLQLWCTDIDGHFKTIKSILDRVAEKTESDESKRLEYLEELNNCQVLMERRCNAANRTFSLPTIFLTVAFISIGSFVMVRSICSSSCLIINDLTLCCRY